MFKIPDLSPQQWALVGGFVCVFVLLTWWSIRDAFSREFDSTNEKVFWIQFAVLVPFLGGIVYLLVGKKRGKKLQ